MPNAKILSCLLGRAIPNGALPIGDRNARDAHEHEGQGHIASSVKEYIAHGSCLVRLSSRASRLWDNGTCESRIGGLNPISPPSHVSQEKIRTASPEAGLSPPILDSQVPLSHSLDAREDNRTRQEPWAMYSFTLLAM